MKRRPILLNLFLTYKNHIIVSVISIFLITGIIMTGSYIYFADDLKSKEAIMNRKDSGIILLDRHENPFFAFYQAKNKTFVPVSETSKYIQLAVIAKEDREFYNHPGFSIKGIIRSVLLNYQNKRIAYGGSTITQQLVKNSLLKPTRSFLRKSQELILALEIERRYTKAEILEMYLNSAYFGAGAFGVEEAADVFFDKKAGELTLAESAVLAGSLSAPSLLSPDLQFPKEIKERQVELLNEMFELNMINRQELELAKNEKIIFAVEKDDLNSIAPHFAIMVRDELIEKFGEENIVRSGFRIKTTLDVEWQKYAEQVVQEQVTKLAVNNASNGSVVVMDPKTGEIKALVGSKDWFDDDIFGKVNVALRERQPGSAFKPIVYAAAFEKGIITPASILNDEPTSYVNPFETYRPVNYDRKFRGKVTARRALANSLNVPSIQVLSKLGLDPAVEMAKRLGITTMRDSSQYGLSLVLGAAEVRPVELTGAYAVFANNGLRNKPTAILQIENKLGNVIYSHVPEQEKILEPEVAFLISSILSDNAARNEVFGNTLTISRPAAVKTGTTEDYRDAWTLGYTPSLTIGVWVGNNYNQSMDQVAGSLGAAPIWRQLMEHYLEGTTVEQFSPPPDIITPNGCPGRKEFFIKGTERSVNCPSITASPSASITVSPSPTTAPTSPTITPTPITPTLTPTPTQVQENTQTNQGRQSGNSGRN